MGVAKKGKRIVYYREKTYFWWVAYDADWFDCIKLHIISEDKSLVLSHRIGDGPKPVISEGTWFQGRQTSGCWERYTYPGRPVMVVTPRIVRDMIAWAVDGTTQYMDVRKDGKGFR